MVLAAALLLGFAQAAPVWPKIVPYHWQEGLQCRWEQCENLDAAIVVPVARGPVTSRRDPSHPDRRVRNYDSERVRVASSLSYPTGSILNVVLVRGRYDEPVEAMVSGRTYLVLVAKPADNKLAEPNSRDSSRFECELKGDNEVLGLALFETRATGLAQGTNPLDRLGKSIVDCLAGGHRQTVRRVCDFLGATRYPNWQWTGARGIAPFPLSERMAAIADRSEPFARARIYRLLYDWRVIGAGDRFLHALVKCAGEPDIFSATDDYPVFCNMEFFEEPTIKNGSPVSYQHDYPKAEEWIPAVAAGKNKLVVRFLLEHMQCEGGTDALEKQLLRFLDDPDAEMRFLVVAHYAAARDLKQIPASVAKDPGPGYDYPDLDVKVAYWMEYWKSR